jgi:hypothetical protein
VTIVFYGEALNVHPIVALNMINVIAGKPTISPQLMLAQVYRSGLLEDIQIVPEDDKCSVTAKRRGMVPHTEIFSLADAKKLMTTEHVDDVKRTIPLADKSNWKQQPRTMLKWRAVAACLRVVFPDLLAGMYTPEEMGAPVQVSEDGGMVVDQGWLESQVPTPQEVKPIPDDPTMANPAVRTEFFKELKSRGVIPETAVKWFQESKYDFAALTYPEAINLYFLPDVPFQWEPTLGSHLP